MPNETQNAVNWALNQTVEMPWGEVIQVDKSNFLVDKVREYFNDNGIEYSTFSNEDLVPYL